MTDDELLRAILQRTNDSSIEIVFDEPSAIGAFKAESGRELDASLRSAHHEGFIIGQRAEGDGSVAYWANLHLSLAGLRRLGQWPPEGREHHAGPWDQGFYGRYARPYVDALLRAHGDQIIHQGDPLDPEDRLRWRALEHLRESGVIQAEPRAGYMQDVSLARRP